MSKLYSLYENLKRENNNTIYLFKNGIFYTALANDAIFLSNTFNFKLTKLNDSIVKCGFPISGGEKYINMLKNNNIDFRLIDPSSNTIFLPKEFKVSNEIKSLLNLILNTDIDHLSVMEAYEFINKLKLEAEHICK